ncbi:stage III sporulation protein AD [Desulforamulus profundi]|uniref:Stage III sporulation protein AD n=1 Tax=Desulforamulus profundi TaxID=1383067 RepID=A0A2C6L1P6_9FIRM|nr:stage III sporulation protein AD [Desulforamulus profundi]
MDILQIVGLGLVVCILAIILRQQKPPMATLLTMTAGVIIFFIMMPQITGVFTVLRDLASQANVSMIYMGTILKIVGIAILRTLVPKSAGMPVRTPWPPRLSLRRKLSFW